MKLSKSVIVGLGVAILATASLGLASWDSHKASDRKTDITFATRVMFNSGQTLPAGTYRMEVPDNSSNPHVEFFKRGKVMATVHAKVVTQEKKNPYTTVDSNTQGDSQLVTVIRPAGWDESLVFAPGGQARSY